MIQNVFNDYLNGTIREKELLNKLSKLKKQGDYNKDEIEEIITGIINVIQENIDNYSKYLKIIDVVSHSNVYKAEFARNNINEDCFFLTKRELENALSKLLFYIIGTINSKECEESKDTLSKMCIILNRWITYFMEKGDILLMNNDEARKFQELLYSLPKKYDTNYYEEINIWGDLVLYYGSVPVGVKIDKKDIRRKG